MARLIYFTIQSLDGYSHGDVHDACMIFAGASQMLPDSGDTVAVPGVTPGPDAIQPSPGARH